MQTSYTQSSIGLDKHGLKPTGKVHWNLGAAELVEHAVRNGDGKLSKDGALVSLTGQHTGRSPNDKFIVRDETTEKTVNWGKVNVGISPEKFDNLHAKVLKYLSERDI